MGFTYSGQQPALVREEMSDVIYERNGQQYQLLDLLSDSYKTFKTVRGTPVADLEGESWVDEAYLTSATTMPKGVKVVITDENGDMQLAVSDMEIYSYLTPEYIASKLDVINNASLCVIDTNLPAETIQYLCENCTVPIFADPVSLSLIHI